MVCRTQPRRGVVILVVLSLLVLFVLLAVTYAIVAGQYDRAARSHARQKLLGTEPQRDLDRAFYQLLRDTPQTGSVIRFHSLLRDYYGEDGFQGQIIEHDDLFDWNFLHDPRTARRSGGELDDDGEERPGQFIDLLVEMDKVFDLDGAARDLRRVTDYYSGRILTIASGPARGLSTRIVRYFYVENENLYAFRVLSFEPDSNTPITTSDLAQAAFIVNGRPFSGTGFGYDSTAGANEPALSQRVQVRGHNEEGELVEVYPAAEIALLPNHAARTDIGEIQQLLGGGSNEAYDAPDYLNMALASPQSTVPIPSFHRPALIRYWSSRASDVWTVEPEAVNAALARHVILRPIEPNFDGSNPYFQHHTSWYENGPWDVDNSGDGIRDSIWVDLGFPAQTAADGRLYKPLFAILCQDMDGRLNVNAHGRLKVHDPRTWIADDEDNLLVQTPVLPLHRRLNNSGKELIYRKGMGYGPPEIDLRWTGITGPPLRPDSLKRLNNLLSSRYGPSGRPGHASRFDLLARLRFFEEPNNYFFGFRSAYSSPSDLRGELAFVLNPELFGQPEFEILPDGVDSRVDSPYELNLLRQQGDDRAYTAAEFEPVVRAFDHDRLRLPQRLADLLSDDARDIVTTHSFDVPMPANSIPPELLDYITAHGLHANNIFDLIAARMHAAEYGGDLDESLYELVSRDLAQGLRFDINRPFGNARDDSGSSVVDDPDEHGEFIWGSVGQTRSEFQDVRFWHPGPSETTLESRLVYAKQLYVLMMTVQDGPVAAPDPPGDPPEEPDPENQDEHEEWEQEFAEWEEAVARYAEWSARAREIAQWAINVVCFRDADSIMIRFEYDVNPFNGWLEYDESDGPHPNRAVVWGAERPELLLTETFAFHDRKTSPNPNYDADDPESPLRIQRDYPLGTAYIELFYPWTGTDTEFTPPNELWDMDQTGLQLNARAPDGTPIWRLAIVREDDDAGSVQIRQLAYFTSNLDSAPTAAGARRFYTDLAVENGEEQPILVEPGGYVVIGGGYPTSLEDDADPAERIDPRIPALEDQHRQLKEAWWVSPASVDGDIVALNFESQAVWMPGGTTGATVVILNRSENPNLDPANPDPDQLILPTSFSISEPYEGWDEDENHNYQSREYDTLRDVFEFEEDRGDTVYLQRLANPLQDYHSVTNPYRTVDSFVIECSIYDSGDDDAEPEFWTWQRGDDDSASNLLWRPEASRDTNFAGTLGRLNRSYGNGQAFPDPPFPWFAWTNRPFVSPYELLHVPAFDSAALLENYGPEPEFPHLFNYFDAGRYRIFDYVHVPSRFVGTEKFLNPTYFGHGHPVSHGWLPPFNRVSKYRVPGLVNINTISDEIVWDAVVGPHVVARDLEEVPDAEPPFYRYQEVEAQYFGPAFEQIVRSREGGDPQSMPTSFANPFRPSGHGNLVPLDEMINPNFEATLMRSAISNDGRLMEAIDDPYRPSSNPFFRYDLMHRLGTMATTRSNVYAVWLTIGYFELEPTAPSEFHPDGYRVGQELGADTGEVRRHRAFYIIDRTIPVAFEPGENHNVDRAVLLRRFIE